MKALGLFVLVVAGLVLTSCSPEKTVELYSKDRSRSEYLHLHSIGGWGFDADIWILSDDTYRVRDVDSHTGSIRAEYVGAQSGLFKSLTKIASDSNLWEITTRSLHDELDTVSQGHHPMITDSNHDFIEFRLNNHTLVADFYAAAGFARHYPSAKQISRFNDFLHAIRKATNRRQH